MNTIAQQIDYATEQLAALNDLLDAQDRFNAVYGGNDTQAIIDAHMRLQRAKLKHAELSGPADYVPPADCEPLNDCGETFPRAKRATGMHPDDPRRGQAADINRQNRGE